MKRLRVIVDDAIPYIKGVLEPYAEVLYCKGGGFAALAENCADGESVPSCGAGSSGGGSSECGPRRAINSADALIVRTRTRCDAALLDGTSVKFIATATIGTDHIDMEYCASKGITVTSAPGCNSGAVMQYVFTALYALSAKKNGGRFRSVVYDDSAVHGDFIVHGDSVAPRRKRVLGVVGVGHVGGKVAALGEALGFEVLRNDPPKEALQEELIAKGELRREDAVRYCPIDELLERSDIVTLHVPLIEKTGSAEKTATCGMAGAEFFAKMKPGAVFINSCRGQVVDDDALAGAVGLSGIILDVWNGEPEISPVLLAKADIATPHIAGYSVEGKINGTVAVVRDFARFFGIEPLAGFSLDSEKSVQHIHVSGISEAEAAAAMLSGFPIMELDRKLRDNPGDFEKIRSGYGLRNEFEWVSRI